MNYDRVNIYLYHYWSQEIEVTRSQPSLCSFPITVLFFLPKSNHHFDCKLHKLVCLFFNFNGIIQYVLFWVWFLYSTLCLLGLSMFLHVIIVTSFSLSYSTTIWMCYSLFTHSTGMNFSSFLVFIQTFLFMSLGTHMPYGISGSYDIYNLNFSG